MNVYVLLGLVIVFEVIVISLFKVFDGFIWVWFLLGIVVGYVVVFYLFVFMFKFIFIGIVYVIWFGVGIVLILLIGWVVFKQKLDVLVLIGMGLIVVGVVVINLFLKVFVY